MTVPPPQLPRVFTGLRLTLGLVVFGQSLATAISASGTTDGSHHNPALLVLAGIEAIAALLFLLPRTTGPAAATLVAIFAVAIALHLTTGNGFPAHLLGVHRRGHRRRRARPNRTQPPSAHPRKPGAR
jgi:hypothetical protein